MAGPSLIGVVLGAALVGASAALRGDVDFTRDVRPILEQHCFRCHGPKRDKADLRLDVRSRALAGAWGGTAPVIVKGAAGESSLYQRLVSTDEEERMPYESDPLAAGEIETIRAWIDAGAPWPDEVAGEDAKGRGHWAYEPLARPEPPALADGLARHPIDAFVDARLEREGIAPAPEADRATLLRRLSLDLTGLPPTIEELDRFERDQAPDAYERCVERVLASPQFGVRMARPWLDLARYADTHGYEKDARRSMWSYRDWVVGAFNANMPFDRFTIEQLAGDLLPNATDVQRLATAFHRNTMLNEEGGTDPEEFRVDAVIDRVNTTATIWLGSTLACAQCHDHKYDPFSQRDYYRLFAAFNSTADGGKASEPVLKASSPEQRVELERIAARAQEIEAALAAPDAVMDAEQREWEVVLRRTPVVESRWSEFRPESVESSHAKGPTFTVASDGTVAASGSEPDRVVYTLRGRSPIATLRCVRLEALPIGGASPGPGRASHGNFVLSEIEMHAGEHGARKIELATAGADFEQANGQFRSANSLDGDAATGWAIGDRVGSAHSAVFAPREPVELSEGEPLEIRLSFESPYANHALGRFRLSLSDDPAASAPLESPALSKWRVAGPYSAESFEVARARIFEPERVHLSGRADAGTNVEWRELDVAPASPRIPLEGERCATYLARTIESDEDRLVELFLGGDDFTRVWIDGRVVFESTDYSTYTSNPVRREVRLHHGTNRLLAKVVNGGGGYGFAFALGRNTSDRLDDDLERIARLAPEQRSADDAARLRRWFRSSRSARGAMLADALEELKRRRTEIEASIPTVLVMRELDEPRESRILLRGSFLTPGERVEPGVPERFGGATLDPKSARLELARWLVSPANPLAARAHVNRTWELLFGRGLASTVADLGTRGEPPTHPELLDWLAAEFVRSGWDVKQLLKTIVTSSTYKRSSDARADAFARDPDNALLARGARYRVEAEMLRDIALATSGLLDARLGGPSVFPPQPPGTWNSAYSGDDWKEDAGEGRHRRGLYTFWKRTAPYVTFALFEAPSREVACTRRARTDTPLQALALLDDPAFVEAAVGLARRMLQSKGTDEQRIELGFRRCTSRHVDAARLAVLSRLLREARESFSRDREAAAARAPDSPGDPVEVAAWTSLASVMLNLDDTLCRR